MPYFLATCSAVRPIDVYTAGQCSTRWGLGVKVWPVCPGIRLMLSVPPATMTSAKPAMMCSAAMAMACRPEAQKRFTV